MSSPSSWERLLDFLLPQRCAGCRRFPRPPLCDECCAQLSPVVRPYCECCGEPFSPLAHHAPQCATCRQTPPLFVCVRSVFLYREPLRTALHHFKFRGRRALAVPLGRLLVVALEGSLYDELQMDAVQFLVPVPLHPSRRRQRGFNQSELLACQIGRRFRKPVAPDWLRRTKNTAPQVGLTATQRAHNVRGAFQVDLPTDHLGCHVLLVDDLYTTGSTMRECARALRRAGLKTIGGLTLARVGSP